MPPKTKKAQPPVKPKVKPIVRPPDEEIVRLLLTKSKVILPPNVVFVTGTKKTIRIRAPDLMRHIKSAEFGRIFFDLKATGENVEIRVPNIEPDPFIYALVYVYDGRIFKRHCEISSVCRLANEYSFPDLADKLIKSCNENITVYNCALLYDQYLEIGESVGQYLDRIYESVCLHAEVAFESRLFKYVSKMTLLRLLKSDHLFIKEKDLYYACMRWINHQLNGSKKIVNSKNQLPLFNEIKHLIRFPLMSKQQFDLGPGKSGLFSQSELNEFKAYFETGNKKTLTTNYNTNERNGLQIHKLHYDDKKKAVVQVDKYAGGENDCDQAQIEPECEVVNLDERDRLMAKEFGKNYSKGGTKRKAAPKAGTKKKLKTEQQQVDVIHLFRFQLIFEDKKQFSEYWNDELVPEIHVDGVRLNGVQFSRYIKSGNAYVSLNRPVAISSDKEFRVCFRTRSNKCLENRFKIANVITVDDDEARVDVKLRIQSKDKLPMVNMSDIFFVYKEDYVEQSSFGEARPACQSEESVDDDTMDSSDVSKENYDFN